MTNYVLVHGSFQGGWIWHRVAERLRAAGNVVFAPTLQGCAERKDQIGPGITVTTQATEVAGLLFYEDLRDVVLVATSTGGLIASKAASLARDRIARLVFVDALAPQPRESVADIVIRAPDAAPYEMTQFARGPSLADAAQRLFGDLDPELRDWVLARYTLHPITASDAVPGELDEFWAQSWKALVICCRGSVNPSQAHQRRTADALNAAWREMDAGHYPMLSHPDELTELLL
jgi:pimeloyl-ACP methyl ester carboxylesterase